MAEQQTIKYSPQWTYITMDNVVFQTNNVVGNFNYLPNVLAYKSILKFLRNCPLYQAFTNCPSVVYQNFLREFWCTAIALDPFPSTYESEKRPVLGRNYSSTEQVNSIQQLLAYSLITGTEVDIGEIIYSDLVTKLLNKSRLKYVSYPRFISCALQVLLGSEYTQEKKFGLPPILSNSNFTKDPSKVTDIKLTAHMIAVNNWRDSVSPPPLVAKPKKGKSRTLALTLPKSQGPKASGHSLRRENSLSLKDHPLRPRNHYPSQRRVLSNPT
ncbi:hypothetical protein Tco_0414198 [Tanacetum coccineum]